MHACILCAAGRIPLHACEEGSRASQLTAAVPPWRRSRSAAGPGAKGRAAAAAASVTEGSVQSSQALLIAKAAHIRSMTSPVSESEGSEDDWE